MTLVAFVLPIKPLSYNAFRDAQRKKVYGMKLRKAYRAATSVSDVLSAPHYGIIYHLHRQEDATDVDNISKPVWDALNGLAYEDDASIALRIAGKLRIGRALPAKLDVTRVPRETFHRLTTFAGKEAHAHILYVELGTLRTDMFGFGLGA